MMKKIIFAFAVGTLFLAAGCSGKGAFTEEEKKAQDSSDEVRQEEGFGALEEAVNSDSNAVVADSTAKGN